jgi:formylglycine-generating enzyme required for sulfatase activity
MENNILPETLNFSHLIEGLEWNDLDFVLVEKGKFWMGSEKDASDVWYWEAPPHEVQITESFYMARYSCCQRLWQLVMESNPSEFQGLNHSVEKVNWLEVQEEFLIKLNQRLRSNRIVKIGCFRLTTEAEWEYPALGGKHQANYTYSGSHRLSEVGYYDKNSNGHTWPNYAIKQTNQLGIYFTSGNILEWCNDIWNDSIYRNRLAKGLYEEKWVETLSDKPFVRVMRGGSWYSDPQRCRASDRDDWYPVLRQNFLGFRLFFSFSETIRGEVGNLQ